MQEISFIEFVAHICKRPAMYTGWGSPKEIIAFIDGYRLGRETPISGGIFDRYVCIRNSFPENYVWAYVINTCAKDEKDAMRLIEKTIVEFVQLRERMSDDELIHYVKDQIVEEGEPERVFRQFDRALLLGDEIEIRSLIDDHNDAYVLWKGAYPQDAAIKLHEISHRQLVKCISVSEDGKKVNIIAQGWPFQIEMNFRKGQWKINAEKIIELRMRDSPLRCGCPHPSTE